MWCDLFLVFADNNVDLCRFQSLTVPKILRGLKNLRIWNDDSVPVTLDLLNTKSIGFDIVSRATIMASFKLFRSGFFVLSS